MKNFPRVSDGIIFQYGGGSMFKPGSYDRYTAFRNNPEADFFIMAWPMGLVQASCNPFNKERELKGVNLGDIAQEVIGKWEPELKTKTIPFREEETRRETQRRGRPTKKRLAVKHVDHPNQRGRDSP